MAATLPFRLTGPEVASLMRRHRATIAGLAGATGIPRRRVREVRAKGLASPWAALDWVEAITGEKWDGGPLASDSFACQARVWHWVRQRVSPSKE